MGYNGNAKTKSLGCSSEIENGLILEKIVSKLYLSVIKNKTPAYNKIKTEFYKVLNIF